MVPARRTFHRGAGERLLLRRTASAPPSLRPRRRQHAGAGDRVSVTTSHPGLIGHCKRSPDWIATADLQTHLIRPVTDGVVAVDHALGQLHASIEQGAHRAAHGLLDLAGQQQQSPLESLQVASQVLGHGAVG